MIRIGICDDEIMARDSLRFMLEKTAMAERGELQVIYEFHSGRNLVHWMRKHRGELDLIFLDVEMEEMNGLEAARQLRQWDGNVLLVFLTGYDDFVFQGYGVGALDYLIKPAKEKELYSVLERAQERLTSHQKQYLLLKNIEGMFRIYKKDILYCYSQGRQVIVVLKERELAFYKKLDEMEGLLGKSFVRIHQRYLVNSGLVDFVGKDKVNLGGIQLPMSRSFKEEAAAALAKRMLEGL